MIRALLILYALGLIAYPAFEIASPEGYRESLERFPQAATAAAEQLQTAAGIHWLKNVYLAFTFLLLARYIGKPESTRDLFRAALLWLGFPLVLFVHDALAQVALSVDLEDLEISVKISREMGLYFAFGVALLGLSRVVKTDHQGAEGKATAEGENDRSRE